MAETNNKKAHITFWICSKEEAYIYLHAFVCVCIFVVIVIVFLTFSA